MGGETAKDEVVPIVGRDNFFNFCHYYLIYLQNESSLYTLILIPSQKHGTQNKNFRIKCRIKSCSRLAKASDARSFDQNQLQVRNSLRAIRG